MSVCLISNKLCLEWKILPLGKNIQPLSKRFRDVRMSLKQLKLLIGCKSIKKVGERLKLGRYTSILKLVLAYIFYGMMGPKRFFVIQRGSVENK